MNDMGDSSDTGCKKTNLYTPKYHASTPAVSDAIYSQSRSLFSSSIEPSSSLQYVTQCPETSRRPVKLRGQSLSAHVTEYYQKYCRGTNLDQYFSFPTTSFEGYACQWQSQTSNAIACGEPVLTRTIEQKSAEISRGRRKWDVAMGDRPLEMIGQSSSVITNSQILHHHPHHQRLTSTDIRSSSPEEVNKYSNILESHDCHKTKNNSPTSSVASNRPLEWDNGADLGYNNLSNDLPPSDDCSSLLRSDPEGRPCPNIDTASSSGTIGGNNQINKLYYSNLRRASKPDAHSTQAIVDETIEFNDDIQVTPIIKSHLSGIITGHIMENKEDTLMGVLTVEKPVKDVKEVSSNKYIETPKSSLPIKSNNQKFPVNPHSIDHDLDNSLKKSVSMNVLLMPLSNVPLTMRSQSEFNLHAFNNIKEGENHPTTSYSTSSITTIVTKPLTCDKDVQTNLLVNIQSKGIQVSDSVNVENNNSNNNDTKKNEVNEYKENKTVLPRRINSLTQKKITDASNNSNAENVNNSENNLQMQNETAHLQSEYETDDAGRASNSFEYFPGDIYQENISRNNDDRDGTTSRVSSSMETGISHSTMPNTSSSFDEKLWGDSDNLLRDLERSLNVLKSLVDANKCDKQVKKRLIHHVIKRLVTAKYTDDKIEHDLADNVPWNPDDTRNKVYRTEIIQALANKQKQQQQNSTENTDEAEENVGEAEEWKVTRIRASSCGKRTQTSGRERRKIIDLVISTENSDIFDERNTDRTDAMQDGRKARMGLRNDDRHRPLPPHHNNNNNNNNNYHRHPQHQSHQHHRKNIIDMDKSESSECFLPQSQGLNYKEAKTTGSKPTIAKITLKSQTSSTTPNTTSSRDTSSQCEIDDKRKQQRNEKIDWRLPTTISERRFDYDRCTSRLGTATRLIDYVEMEKKNQLVWINSEINHLSNLKKLLEEPKKYENITDKKTSPRKTFLNSDKRSNNSTSTSLDLRTLNKQWSSHGNIAERCDKTCKNTIASKVFTKRNSYTQTAATNTNREFSRCDFTDKISNACVQTCSPVQSSRSPSPWSPRRYCRQHGNKRSNCHCERPSSLSPRRCRDKLIDKHEQTVNQSAINSNKDTKNILNDQCKSEFNDVTEYPSEFCRVNQQHRRCCCGNSIESPKFCKNNSVELTNNSSKYDESRDKHRDKSNENNKSQDVRSCRVCGLIYSNDNRQCQCKLTYMKPIAYELSFEEAKKSTTSDTKKPRGQPSTATITLATHESCKTSNCSCSPTQLQLKDYLTKNKPEFVDNVEMRKRYMSEITQLRQLKKEKRKQLLAMASPNSLIMTQKTIKRTAKISRNIGDDEMKIRLRMRYLRLNEVRNKRRQREKEEQARRNHLMAKIFCKKLQQKVLEGQVDVSQSVSVISNL